MEIMKNRSPDNIENEITFIEMIINMFIKKALLEKGAVEIICNSDNVQ